METLTVQLTNNTTSTLNLVESSRDIIGIPHTIPPGVTANFSQAWSPSPGPNNLIFEYHGDAWGLQVAVERAPGKPLNMLDTNTDGPCMLQPRVPDGWEHNTDLNPRLPLNLTSF
jgi:hypothetical protein